MGCWNGTCAVSNLHIIAGTPVAVFLLLENRGNKSFCYTNALNDLCPLPFYGEYNDYGAVENCHGFGLNIIVEALREQLYEFGEGPNSSHDTPVNKSNFDIDVLFEADHEDRLGIHQTYTRSDDEYDLRELQKMEEEKGLTESQKFELDRLADKIKKVDTFRRVTHVIIHGSIFKDIMEKWYIEDYIGEGKGNKGYNNNYIHIYFKDILADIPAYVQRLVDEHAEVADVENPKVRSALRRMMMGRHADYDDPNLAAKWLNYLSARESMNYGLVHANEIMSEYAEEGKWDDLKAFIVELLTTFWVNAFMDRSRKVWTKQSGAGSQNSEHLPYRILTQSMNDIMDAENAEQESWDDEFETDEADASA